MNAWNSRPWRRLLALSLVLALAACQAPSPGNPPAAGGETPAVKTTNSGFACPEPQPRLPVTSTALNLFVWTEYIPADILECFGLVYGLQVNREEFSSNEELYAKLEAGAAGYDIVHPSDYIINVMIRAGLLQPLDMSQLPNLANIDPEYLKLYGDRAAYIAPYQVGSQAIIYDSERVPNPPQAWADLWRPEFARHMVFVDDSRIIIGMTLLSLGYSVNTTDAGQLAEAEAKLKELVPNVKLFDSDSPKTALIAGDADLGIVWNGEAFLAQREKPSLQYVFPREGAITFEDGFGIPKSAPHVDAANAWINYVLQPDVAWLLLQDYPYTLPNRAALEFARINHAELYQAYTDSPITNTPAATLLAGARVEDVGAALTQYDRIWTEVKGGQ
ncbi:MAG: spermidine/putrescine ABC transporter substrate-binding protein [Anaerolineales bacterium]|nr:spermidine/putrescine ABC transporter substrate-binding protein [Anaerolineales bacterium]